MLSISAKKETCKRLFLHFRCNIVPSFPNTVLKQQFFHTEPCSKKVRTGPQNLVLLSSVTDLSFALCLSAGLRPFKSAVDEIHGHSRGRNYKSRTFLRFNVLYYLFMLIYDYVTYFYAFLCGF